MSLPRIKSWKLYIIEKQGRYYTGITNDLPHRLRQHKVAFALYIEEFPNKYAAAKRERQIKHWHRKQKERLISGK